MPCCSCSSLLLLLLLLLPLLLLLLHLQRVIAHQQQHRCPQGGLCCFLVSLAQLDSLLSAWQVDFPPFFSKLGCQCWSPPLSAATALLRWVSSAFPRPGSSPRLTRMADSCITQVLLGLSG